MKKINLSVIKEYLTITLGVFLVAFGAFFFEFPNRISTGGVTGLSLVLNQIFSHIAIPTFVSVFNIILLAAGFIILGKNFGIKTVYGTIVFTSFLELFEFIPFSPAFSLPLTNQPLLELIYAIGFISFGSSILFFNNASSGGTDILALIIKKYTRLDNGKALLAADAFLVLLTFYNFENKELSFTTGLISFCAFFIKSIVVNNVLENLNRSKHFLVITSHKNEVENYITNNLQRSATSWKCEGAYTKKEQYAIISVMNPMQAYKLRQYLKQTDPKAFSIITNTSDIMGEGFRQI